APDHGPRPPRPAPCPRPCSPPRAGDRRGRGSGGRRSPPVLVFSVARASAAGARTVRHGGARGRTFGGRPRRANPGAASRLLPEPSRR
ncbi:MAG: hypothetical protein AVDCRST_MAG90-629, partial [uncultured Microvirga sp.]